MIIHCFSVYLACFLRFLSSPRSSNLQIEAIMFVFPHRQCGGCKIVLCYLPLPPCSSGRPHHVTVRMSPRDCPADHHYKRRRPAESGASSGWPVLWLTTEDAVQLTVPTGDNGQLMSGASPGWPVLDLDSGPKLRIPY